MKSQEAHGALNKAIDQIKKDKQEEKTESDMGKGMMNNVHMGKFESPMGSGVVIRAKPSYEGPKGEPPIVDHHHFLTHGPTGKALTLPQHFIVSAPQGKPMTA